MSNIDVFFEQFESGKLSWFVKHPRCVFGLIVLTGVLLTATILIISCTCFPLTLVSGCSGLLLGAILFSGMVILACKVKDKLIACYQADVVAGFYKVDAEDQLDEMTVAYLYCDSFTQSKQNLIAEPPETLSIYQQDNGEGKTDKTPTYIALIKQTKLNVDRQIQANKENSTLPCLVGIQRTG